MPNSVSEHNYFITQSSYIGYMFRLLTSHLQAYFNRFSYKMLQYKQRTFYMYFNFLITQFAHHSFRAKLSSFMYSIDENTLGSQCVHNIS